MPRRRPTTDGLAGGALNTASAGAPAILAHIKSGKLRCIAVGTKKRLTQLPDVSTVAESGFPGFEMTQRYALDAPANMSQIAIDKIAATTERLRADTAQPVGDTPVQYATFIAAEQARWKVVAARANIKPD